MKASMTTPVQQGKQNNDISEKGAGYMRSTMQSGSVKRGLVQIKANPHVGKRFKKKCSADECWEGCWHGRACTWQVSNQRDSQSEISQIKIAQKY